MNSPIQDSLLIGPSSNSTQKSPNSVYLTLIISIISALALIITFLIISVPHHSDDLCASSPNPPNCHAIISDSLPAAAVSSASSPVDVLHTVLDKLLLQIDVVIGTLTCRRTKLGRPALAVIGDCAELLDLSRDRVLSADVALASGEYTDARTWLSAVLTNQVTCLDELDAGDLVKSDWETLKSMASASLAVLNAADHNAKEDYYITKSTISFPSWVPVKDRKLMEISADAIQANAVVAEDGSGNYKTVQAAVDAAPNVGKSRYVLHVKKGTYKENVSIGKKKTNLMIVGDGMDATVIIGSLNVADGSTTFNSATLAANGDGLILQDLKIENTAGPEKHQAVALRVSADKSTISRCRIEGYQDTLYTHSLRQFYRDSTVTGTVDFIFGNAAVVLQNCNIVARRPMSKQKNAITAQGRTDPNQNTGTSVQNCSVVASSELAPVKSMVATYLGRPWKEYSRTVFMESYLDDHIDPKGWLEWDGDFALKTLFYGEYMNKGPGAVTASRVKWPGYKVITDVKVAWAFTVKELIQGGSWLESTGVEYNEGL